MNKAIIQLRFFLYLRRSQDSEDRQVASIDDQRDEMLAIAKRLGLNIVAVFEESQSAKEPGRPVFNNMLDRVKSGEADGILCWKLNRLARNPVDGGQIQWLLQQGAVKHIRTYASDYWPTDNVMNMAVELGMANQFVLDLSGDIKRGMRRKALRGWNPHNYLPPGYRHNKEYKENPGQPEILPTSDLATVKRLLSFFLEGTHSRAETHRKAAVLGLRNKKDKAFSYNTISNMLTHPMYMGWFSWRDEDNQLQWKRGNHEAIITERQHRRILLLLGENGWSAKKPTYNFAFRGPLTCGECDSPITAEHKLQCICTGCKHKFSCKTATACPKCHLAIADMSKPVFVEKTYYRCTKKRKDYRCSQKYVEEGELHNAIFGILQDLDINNHFYKWGCLSLRTVHKEEIGEQEAVVKDIGKKRDELLQRIDNLVIMRADRDISADEFIAQKRKTEVELAEVEQEYRLLDQRALHWAEIAGGYLKFLQTACDVFEHSDDLEEKREILRTLGSNLEIVDRKPRFTMQKPITALKNMHVLTCVDLGEFEPEKVLAGQGFSKEKAAAFSTLCTRMKDIRTTILETKECFLPAYCLPTGQGHYCHS
jgi:DNA invertase Pin-like site-specific DNA recombinase